MKITKFAHSCILIETKDTRVLIDPGYLKLDHSLLKNSWINIDFLLVTHKHPDHCHTDSIKEIIRNHSTKFYSTREVAREYSNISPMLISEGESISGKNIRIEVMKAVHGYIPLLKGDKEIHENVGYIVDDSEKRAYVTSDTICFKNEYKCNVLLVPVSNHGVVMGPFEAALFAKETGAGLVIPTHYDNPKFPTDLKKVEGEFQKQDIHYRILGITESIDV